MCQTTLAIRIDHKDEAIELLKRAEQCSDEVADDIHNELHMLYGKLGGGLLPLEPDLIGEHHVAEIADDKLVDACLAWAQEDGARRRGILTVLNRSTRQKEHGELSSRATNQLRRLLANKALEQDLWQVAIGTPGLLLKLINERRNALSLPEQETIQQSSREERVEQPSAVSSPHAPLGISNNSARARQDRRDAALEVKPEPSLSAGLVETQLSQRVSPPCSERRDTTFFFKTPNSVTRASSTR